MKKDEIKPLTAEQTNEVYAFIGKCVLKNVGFRSFTMGTQRSLTIQDILNTLDLESLRSYGTAIYEENKKKSGSPFKKGDSTFYVGTGKGGVKISGDSMITILQLIIQDVEFDQQQSDKKAKAEKIRKELDAYKTPDEKRADLERELALLEGEVDTEPEPLAVVDPEAPKV